MQEKLVAYLKKSHQFSLTKAGKLKLGNSPSIRLDKILTHLSEPTNLQKFDLVDFYLQCQNKELELSKALDKVERDIKAEWVKKSTSDTPEEFHPQNVKVGVDQYKKDIYILNNKYERLPVEAESWKEVFGGKEYNELPKLFCKMVYNPYSLDKVLAGTGKIKTINTCVHPEWRYGDLETPKTLDPLFLDFFEGLFETKKSLKYTCSWYLNSILDRNETALVMVGAKAVGKNIFCSSFDRMVGQINVSNQANNAYEEKFNGFLKNTRIVVADEVSFKDGNQKNRVKKYFNKVQAVELKNSNSETIEVFCSMVMLSNDVRDLYIEADDRRFSCIDLTKKTLPSRMTPENINKLRHYIEYDEDFPVSFWQYLNAHKDENFVNALPFKGEIFEKLVMSSLSGVKTAILNKVIEGVTDYFTLKDVDFDWEKEYPRRKPSFFYFEEFFTNYRHEGKSLGKITPARRTLDYIVNVNPELLVVKPESKI